MIHFIRNEKNETLLDLDVYVLNDGTNRPELSVYIDIAKYSDFLLGQDNPRLQQTTKFVFDKLSKAREWYWEIYRETINKNPSKEDVNAVIGLMVKSAANVLKLNYVTD